MIKYAPQDDEVPQAVLDELNRMLAARNETHNAASDPEMGGLSPNQVAHLLYSDWGEDGGAIQFRTDLPLSELEGSAFFRRVRTVLQTLSESGGVRATSGKNLSRRFVSDMLPLVCDDETREKIHMCRRVINEEDVWPLHIPRVVAQTAGLIRLYKGKFVVPKSKTGLLRDERAGELFVRLFTAYFRKFNLAYAHGAGPEAGSLQTCAGYTIYCLGVVAADWRSVAELPAEILLPRVIADVEREIAAYQYWSTDELLTLRLIEPLVDWGLLEGRYDREVKFYKTLTAVRITPLYRSLLRFRLDPSPHKP